MTNGTSNPIPGINPYRGMPVGVTGDDKTIYTSARDIGNIVAGYIAAANGLSWKEARLGFDLYQSFVSKKPDIEGISTRNAQYYGWKMGYNNTSLMKKMQNLGNSIRSYINTKCKK